MSSIAGMFAARGELGPAAESVVGVMLQAMQGRGVDATGSHTSACAVSGCNAFFTNGGEETHTQPIVNASAGLSIVADARLDNREALIQALGVSSSAIPDPALILEAYKAWGTDCADRLLGDFAFAIVDEHQRRLYAAVDPFAVRPFYYHYHNHQLVFASSMQGLVASGSIEKTPCEKRLRRLLEDKSPCEDAASTMYTSVKRLPAAHQLVLSGGSLLVSRY